ncbi:TPA: hypothetical protein ACQYCV_004623 [Vibrio parahaemolyticus]|nr:hypothetical protein [Vibrio parahaemolyticus]
MFQGVLKKHPKFAFALFALLCGSTLFLVFSDDYSKTFEDNLVPEFVGVAVELALIIFVLDIIALKQEKKRSRQLEKRAREYLRFIVVNLLKDSRVFDKARSVLPSIVEYESNRNDFKFFASERARSNEVIDALVRVLATSESEVHEHIQNHVSIELASFHSLFPIVAEISEDHFKTWGRIVYFLTKVAKGDDIESNIIAVLQKIKKFDEKTGEVFGDLS